MCLCLCMLVHCLLPWLCYRDLTQMRARMRQYEDNYDLTDAMREIEVCSPPPPSLL